MARVSRLKSSKEQESLMGKLHDASSYEETMTNVIVNFSKSSFLSSEVENVC